MWSTFSHQQQPFPSHRKMTQVTFTLAICYLLCSISTALTILHNDFKPITGSKGATTATNPLPSAPDGRRAVFNVNSSQKYKTSVSTEEGVTGYAAEWEYKGEGLHELDSPFETQLSPSSSGKSNTSQHATPNNPSPIPYPSRREGPGTWLDSKGFWFIYGGQGPSIKQNSPNVLSNLWVYGPSEPQEEKPSSYRWQLIYRAEKSDEIPVAGKAQDTLFPIMCGDESSGRLSLFKRQIWNSVKSREGRNSLFNEDEAVWVTEIPQIYNGVGGKLAHNPSRYSNSKGESKRRCSNCSSTEDLFSWTSYICCDACLPDAKPTFDFCPQFHKDPILWCSHDSLMAFLIPHVQSSEITSQAKPKISLSNGKASQNAITSPTGKVHGISQQENTSEAESHYDTKMEKNIPSSKSHISSANTNNTIPVVMKNESNSDGVGQLEKSTSNPNALKSENGDSKNPSGIKSSVQEQEKVVKPLQGTNGPEELSSHAKLNKDILTIKVPTVSKSRENLVVNWWKFDLTSKEWVKMPEVKVRREEAQQIWAGTCRTVGESEGNFLYILCPSKGNVLDRTILLFDPSTSSIQSIGTIHLNNAFHDKKVWQLGRSILHAVRSEENKKTVIFLAYHKLLDLWIHDHSSNKLFSVENVWKGASLHAFQHTSSFYKLSLVLSSKIGMEVKAEKKRFFMVNPRSKILSFEDPFPSGYFQITIVQDRSVFLPSRDAPSLINGTDQPIKSQSEITFTRSILPFMEKLSTSSTTMNVMAVFGDKTPAEKPKDPIKYDQRRSQIPITRVKPGQSKEEEEGKVDTRRQATTQRMRSGLLISNELIPTTTIQSNIQQGGMNQGNEDGAKKEENAGTEQGESHEPSQSKLNLGQSSSKNYNKANNSQVKGSENVQGSLESQSTKETLRIKALEGTTKIDDDFHSTPRTVTRSHESDIEDATNEMRFPTNPSSLPVNNESNEKHVEVGTSFGESQSQSNIYLEPPRALPVLDVNKTKTTTGTENKRNLTATSREAKSVRDGTNLSIETLGFSSRSETTTQPSQDVKPSLLNFQTKDLQPKGLEVEAKNANYPNVEPLRLNKEEQETHNYEHDAPNLESNYVSSRRAKESKSSRNGSINSRSLMRLSSNESFMADMASGRHGPLTLSDIMIDSASDQSQSIDGTVVVEPEANYYISYSSLGSLIFFSLSLGLFAAFGLFIFFRRCVKCPPRDESALIKEPPPIRYSVAPDELSFHHIPIV